MSIPVSTIQPPQIVNSQPKANIAANTTAVKAQPQAPIAANTAPLPAKKLEPSENEKANGKNENMKLQKSAIGVINPPQDTYKYSLHNEVKEKQEANKDILDLSKPLASSSLAGGEEKSGGVGGFFKKLIIVAAGIAGAIFVARKLKLSSIASGNISNLTDLKSHVDNVVNISKKGTLKAFNVKKTSIRLIDESADTIKEALNSTRKLTTETRNIEGKTPKVIIKLKETAGNTQKAIKKAFAEGNIDSLSDDALKDIEYVNLEYVSSDKKKTEVIVNTIKSKFIDDSNPHSDIYDRVVKFFKEFLGD